MDRGRRAATTTSSSNNDCNVRRWSIMDYGWCGSPGGAAAEDSGDQGGRGAGKSSRRASFTGEQSDLDFLHQQQEEALIPLKEDLADWINKLLGVTITVETFMDVLDSGVYVCKLAKLIQAKAEEAVKDGRVIERLPHTRLRFKENARSGTWFARDNIANFIKWCRDYGVKEECLFETEGLVSHSTPRNFVLCLLELGRMAYKYGMEAPCLVAMEKEIDRLEQSSTNGDAWEPTVQDVSAPGGRSRDSHIPVVRQSSSSLTSNGTSHSSMAVWTNTQDGSPSPASRRRARSVADSEAMIMPPPPPPQSKPRQRSPGCEVVDRSRRHSALVGTNTNGHVSPKTKRNSCSASTSTLAADTVDAAVGTPPSVRRSTATSTHHVNGSTGTVDGWTATDSGSGTGRRAVAVGTSLPDKTVCSNGTMTSEVDTKVNASSNTEQRDNVGPATPNFPVTSTMNGSTSPQPPPPPPLSSSPPSTPRSVWRRSASPHGTRIPVPIGTSAHGTLSHGVSSTSINSMSGSACTTPRQTRRRASVAGTPTSSGEWPRPLSGTKTPRRRSMSTKSDKSDELDKEVRRISQKCECPQCYQIDRLSEGKYKIGDRVVFVRLLKGKHVMVRVGGGWDTLDHYLSTHDPCRVMEVRREPSSSNLTLDDDKFLFIHGRYKIQTPVGVQ